MSNKQIHAINRELEKLRQKQIAEALSIAGLKDEELAVAKSTLAKELNTKAVEKLTKAKIQSALASTTLTDAQKKQVTTTLLGKAANDQMSLSFATLKANAIAAGKAMIMNPMTWVSVAITGISLLVSWWEKTKQAAEEARQATIDAGNVYQDTADSIDDYANKIAELKDSLDSGNLSEQEAYQARLNLLSIQDKLMDLYGGEIEQLDLLTTSADEAARALNGVTVAMANENLNKYATTIKDAIAAMEGANTYTISGVVLNDSTIERQIKDIVAKYQGATLEVIPGNSVSRYNSMLTITADAEGAKETLNSLATDFRTLREELRNTNPR